MVQIKIKGLNNAYHIFANFDDIEEFFKQLKERLKVMNQFDQKFEAFFHLPNLKDEQIVRLFDICNDNNTIVLGINPQDHKSDVRFLKEDIRGGEHYEFDECVVLFGNIHKQAYVVCENSLYVIGNVEGTIDLLHEECALYTSMLDANVRICDGKFQNLTSFAPSFVYYKDKLVLMEKSKEEMVWEKL